MVEKLYFYFQGEVYHVKGYDDITIAFIKMDLGSPFRSPNLNALYPCISVCFSFFILVRLHQSPKCMILFGFLNYARDDFQNSLCSKSMPLLVDGSYIPFSVL